MLLPCFLDKCAQRKRNLISKNVFSQILVYLEGVRCTGEKRNPIYICTKFNVLGINFIVGRFRCMIYVMKSMAHVVILDYLNWLFLG